MISQFLKNHPGIKVIKVFNIFSNNGDIFLDQNHHCTVITSEVLVALMVIVMA